MTDNRSAVCSNRDIEPEPPETLRLVTAKRRERSRLAEAVRLLADVEDRSMVDVITEIDRQRKSSIDLTSRIYDG